MFTRQLTTPLMIRGFQTGTTGEATLLQRVSFDDPAFNEHWFQDLLFKNPSLLPLNEIDPVFSNALPVCTELPVPGGAIDLLFINPSGFITIVETKLRRNPEARHEVVSQVIRYASEMAQWSYDDLVNAVRKRQNGPDDPIRRIIQAAEQEGGDEVSFVEQVNRNLWAGRFMLLIAGDGIRLELERMRDYLQLSPALGFRLALVEMAVYGTAKSEDFIIVQPRVLVRTEVIKRNVIEIKVPLKPSDLVISAPEPFAKRGGTITEEEYYKQLTANAGPDVVKFVEKVLDEASDHSLRVEWMKAGPVLKYDNENKDTFFNFGQLRSSGEFADAGYLFFKFKELGLPLNICREYMDKVANLVGHGTRRVAFERGGPFDTEQILVGANREDFFRIEWLIPVEDQWLKAIDEVIERIQKTTTSE
jgi:hypothetical protein